MGAGVVCVVQQEGPFGLNGKCRKRSAILQYPLGRIDWGQVALNFKQRSLYFILKGTGDHWTLFSRKVTWYIFELGKLYMRRVKLYPLLINSN